MRTFLCDIWLYTNLLGGAFFASSIYQWVKSNKKSYLLLTLGIACIIIPGLTYLNSVKVPNVVGLQVDSAKQTLQSSGLQVELDFNGTYSDIVLRQNISPDSYVKKGTFIILYDEAYSPAEEFLEIESQKESTNLLFPVVNLEDAKAEDIAAEYEDFIGNLIVSSNLKDILPLDFYKEVNFKVFEKAGTVYYKNGDSIICVDLMGKKIITSYLFIVDYDTLNIINTYEIANGIIENPFEDVNPGKYFVVLLSNNYKLYIWGPIQLQNTKPKSPLSFSAVSFALVPEDAVFSDIKCIQIKNDELNNSLFGRYYFVNAISIFEKDTIEPVSSAPSSIELWDDITAFSPYDGALDISSLEFFQPVAFQDNNYGYLSSIYYNNCLCAFSVSDRYMLRIEHKKIESIDFFWKNRYIDISFSDYNGNTVVINNSHFLKCE